MSNPGKISTALFSGLVILALAAWLWMKIPVAADMSVSDPAIVHANKACTNADYTSAWFEHAGHKLHYVEAGDGELVLFLHGFPSFWFSFIRQMDAMKDDYRVVAIDGLGAGKSDAPHDVAAYRLENMAAHLEALIDHLGAEKVHIVGHDWGATFAFGFAQRYPERVASVTGLSAPPQNVLLSLIQRDSSLRQTSAYIERLKQANPLLIVATGGDKKVWTGAYEPLVEKGLLTPEEGDLFREATGNPKRINAHINWYRANIPPFDKIRDADFWPERGARLHMPALIVWGQDDRVFAKQYAEATKVRSDQIRMLPLAGVGHWPHVERAETVTQAIKDLISEETPLDPIRQ
ncbi:MAG: alpha/beta hydrolase [Pseudomonadota bacterium]